MYILKVGVNHVTAPVEIREKLAFSENELAEAMVTLKEQKSILENVILSTCNRTEIFAVVDQLHTGRYYIKQFLEDWFNIKKETFSPYLAMTDGDDAIEHLFKLTAGLDSMILGETQILGQVRDAFFVGQKAGTTGTIFNELFKQAVTFAKRAHHETAIGENAVSVSYAAVELAKNIFADITDKHVVVLGAGKMGELAAKNLQGSGVKTITVVNRTLENAQKLAEKFQAKAVPLTDLSHVLETADILISSTGSQEIVMTKRDLTPVLKKRKGRPLFLVDIAVPRDLDPAIDELDDVFLYDIDNLQHIVDENLETRQKAAAHIESMIGEEIIAFNQWVRTLGVVPVIIGLREKALSIQAATMKSIENKLPDLTEREKKILNKHTKSIVNQLLKDPITQAKELSGTKNADKALELFVQIFGIEEQVKDHLKQQAKKDPVTKEKVKSIFPFLEKLVSVK